MAPAVSWPRRRSIISRPLIRLLRSKPRGRLLAPRLMAAVYRAMLQDMLVQGWIPPRRHVRIGKPRLLWIVARCSVFG